MNKQELTETLKYYDKEESEQIGNLYSIYYSTPINSELKVVWGCSHIHLNSYSTEFEINMAKNFDKEIDIEKDISGFIKPEIQDRIFNIIDQIDDSYSFSPVHQLLLNELRKITASFNRIQPTKRPNSNLEPCENEGQYE